MSEIERQGGGITRRELMKRGAIGGTILWAAPVIASVGPAAFAHDLPGSPRNGCCECTGCPSPPGNAQGLFCGENSCLGQAGCESFCASVGCTGPSANHCGPNIIDCSGGVCLAH